MKQSKTRSLPFQPSRSTTYSVAKPRAVVVGAGIAGIASAARLARQGYQVTVLEKNAQPGGRCGQIVRDGHRFDVGATLFLMPEIFAETYAALGQRMEDHLQLQRVDPTYNLTFADGTGLALGGNLTALQPQLEALEAGSFAALLRYLQEGERHYRLALRHFVGRNFTSLPGYLAPFNLWLIWRMKALRKHYANVSRYFKHPQLRAAFTFQNMYLGLSPFDAPATYSLLQYTEMVGGVWLPRGGMFRVVESLVDIAQSHGVRFHFRAPVQAITVEGRRVSGVVLEDGTVLLADVVVANADLPYVYEKLLPAGAAPRRLARMKYTSSTIMFYWALDQVYPQLQTHNIFLGGAEGTDYRASFERIFHDHQLPQDPSFYVHAPARSDVTAAPAGADTLMVLVPVGHLDPSAGQQWNALQAQARSTVLGRLAAAGLPDLEAHLKFEISFTPRQWQNIYNLARGAAFGLGHDVWQVGYLRPHNRCQRYGNLFFTGSSTHPGAGVPLALLSARLTTERILQATGAVRTIPMERHAYSAG